MTIAQGDLVTTAVGTVVDELKLRFTPAGRAQLTFRLAINPRYQDNTGTWKDAEPVFQNVVVWAQLAENAANSFGKGDRIIVHGAIRQRRYENEDGEKRTITELNAENIGPDLRFATCRITKMSRSSTGAAPAGGSDRDPWATAAPAR